jgi:hypothetical protein
VPALPGERVAAVSGRVRVRKAKGAAGWLVTWELSWSWHANWKSAMYAANYVARRR